MLSSHDVVLSGFGHWFNMLIDEMNQIIYATI